MHPVLVQIGPLVIRWYGAMIATACMVGLWLARKEAQRKGISREKIDDFESDHFRHFVERPKKDEKPW